MLGKRTEYIISDALWKQILPLLPSRVPGIDEEPAVMGDRRLMESIFHVFRTGWKWESLPHSPEEIFKVRECFGKWQRSGLFQRMWNAGLLEYDDMRALVRYGNVSNIKSS